MYLLLICQIKNETKDVELLKIKTEMKLNPLNFNIKLNQIQPNMELLLNCYFIRFFNELEVYGKHMLRDGSLFWNIK